MTSTTIPARRPSERGSVLLEMAMTLPLLLLVTIAIFELGRAYQTQQILTNAAREGARMAVLPDASVDNIRTRVRQYLADGQLANAADADVDVDTTATMAMGAGTVSSSVVTVNLPFQFMVLGPVARLVVSNSTMGAPIVLSAASQMRNETQF